MDGNIERLSAPERDLKIRLLAEGASVSDRAAELVAQSGKVPVAARTGVANGLEVVLPAGTWVNVPILPADQTAHGIDCDVDGMLLTVKGVETRLTTPLRPQWYGRSTAAGTPYLAVGTLRGDRLGIALLKDCRYFHTGLACSFCAIRSNDIGERKAKTAADVVELAVVAVMDPQNPARHVYFDLGQTWRTDSDLPTYEPIMEAFRCRPELRDVSVHLNQTVPHSREFVSHLVELGFSEVSFNIEVSTEEAAWRSTPGKQAEFGLQHHLDVLETAADLFPPGCVSSCLVVGLQPVAETLLGVELLMARGVVPKLSVFRPLSGAALSASPRPPLAYLRSVLEGSLVLSERYGVPLGPLCGPCQMLSLT